MTKEEKREYMKKWRDEHREQINARRREYYRKHPEVQRKYSKKWAEENQEKVKEIRHQYYLNHKEEMRAKNKEWIKNNKRRWIECNCQSRKRRIERLKESGVINAWNVVNYGKEPIYVEENKEN